MARDGQNPEPPELELGAGSLIISPTYNERSNLEAFVEAALGNAPRAHLLIVDDNSPDGTGLLADELALRDERELAAGADIVIGSRNVPGGQIMGWGPGRHLLSKGGSLYSRLILGVEVRDLTSGYKAFTRRALEAIFVERVDSNGYAFQVEMTFRALQLRLTVREVPIVFLDRQVGASKMDRKIVLEAVTKVLQLRARSMFRARQPG